MKLKDISKGTIVRTAVLLFALTNQILTMLGYSVLPFSETEVEQFVSTLLTVIASLVAWWGDNAVTPKRIEAKKYYKKICSQCGHEIIEKEGKSKMANVFIGVGHGGRDYGTCANGLKESEIALDIAFEMNKILQQHGVNTMISRTTQGTDEQDDLLPKISRCNAYAPDLAIDIHINAGGGRGFEAFYYHGGGTSLKMAQEIEKEVKAMGQVSRGLKTRLNAAGNDYFGFIRQVTAPSVILEAAFIDNVEDVEKIRSAEGRKKFAVAYAKGVLNTLGIPYNKNSVTGECVANTGRYDTLEQIPAGEFRNTVAELMDKGIIKGGADGKLNLSEDMVRMFVINNRAGLYK